MLLFSSLIAISVSQAPVASASEMMKDRSLMPQSLFYEAGAAAGFWYCDRKLAGAQARRFDKRYGERVIALAVEIREREGLGWHPDDIVISTCRGGLTREVADEDFRAFGKRLSELETQYSGTASR
jgi:hypothetical protein